MREACFTVLDWYILESRIRTPALTAKGNYSSTLCNPHTPNIASLMTNFFYQGNCLTFQSLLRFHQWQLFLFETFFFCSACQPVSTHTPNAPFIATFLFLSFCGKCQLLPRNVARPLFTLPRWLHISCYFSCCHIMDEWLKSFSLQTQLLYPLEYWAYKCLAIDSEQEPYLHLKVNVPKLSTSLPFSSTVSWAPKVKQCLAGKSHKSILLGTLSLDHISLLLTCATFLIIGI